MNPNLDDLENILNGRQGRRQILEVYQKAEIDRLNPAVYEPLLKNNTNPKIKSMVDSARTAKDPYTTIDTLRTASFVLDSFGTIKDSILEGFEEVMELDISDLNTSDFDELNELKAIGGYVKEMVVKLDYLRHLTKSTVSVLETHYDDLASAIRKVSDTRKISISDTVRNTDYLYEASRIVIPEREWAEKFLTITSKGSYELMDSIATVGLLIEKSLGKSDVSSEIVQTRKAFKIVSDAVVAYRMKELDAIYVK